MTIRNWPAGEQPREKLLNQGAATLSDAELLAIFLRTGLRGKSAVEVGRDLLISFGSLRAVLEAGPEEFCRLPGLGPVKYIQLQAALEVGRRNLHATLTRNTILNDPAATYNYLTSRLRHQRQEVFACVFLDNQHRVIHYEELTRGTFDQAVVYPREILKRTLHHNAAAVILSHNHPSGIAKPSRADRDLTEHIKTALALISTRVLDHVIIGEGEIFSFAEQGLL